MKVRETDLRVQCVNALEREAGTAGISAFAEPSKFTLRHEADSSSIFYTVTGDVIFVVDDTPYPCWIAYTRGESIIRYDSVVKLTILYHDMVSDSEFSAPSQDLPEAFAEEVFEHFKTMLETKAK